MPTRDSRSLNWRSEPAHPSEPRPPAGLTVLLSGRQFYGRPAPAVNALRPTRPGSTRATTAARTAPARKTETSSRLPLHRPRQAPRAAPTCPIAARTARPCRILPGRCRNLPALGSELHRPRPPRPLPAGPVRSSSAARHCSTWNIGQPGEGRPARSRCGPRNRPGRTRDPPGTARAPPGQPGARPRPAPRPPGIARTRPGPDRPNSGKTRGPTPRALRARPGAGPPGPAGRPGLARDWRRPGHAGHGTARPASPDSAGLSACPGLSRARVTVRPDWYRPAWYGPLYGP